METALISVIVPVYNVAQYLEKSIASIQQQTYQNLEIILVDDGATDESDRLCEQIAEQDERVLVYHKENEGLSQARNDGLKQAHGDYVIFIDSDDYIHSEMIASLYQQLVKEDADVSSCGVMNVYANSESPQTENQDDYFVCDTETFLREYLIGEKIPGTICNKLIKKEVAAQLTFPKGLIYEDAYYHFDLIKVAKKYVVNTNPYYYYFPRGDSITTKPYAEKDLAYIDIYQKFYTEVVKEYPNLTEVAFFRLAYAHFFILDKMLLDDNFKEFKDYPRIYGYLKKHAFAIFKNTIFRKGRRISALALFVNVRLYRILLFKNIEQSKKIN